MNTKKNRFKKSRFVICPLFLWRNLFLMSLLSVFFLPNATSQNQEQQITIAGTVTDGVTGEALIGATVIEKNVYNLHFLDRSNCLSDTGMGRVYLPVVQQRYNNYGNRLQLESLCT